MFESSAPFALFDYFRVPYQRAAQLADNDVSTEVISPGHGHTFSWPAVRAFDAERRHSGTHFVGSVRIFGRVLGDAEMRSRIRRAGGSWHPVHLVRDEQGNVVSSGWRRDDGSSFVPFDPNEVIWNYWSESYLNARRTAGVVALARRGYYAARPLLPRNVQMTLRRWFGHVQGKARFPRWPVETALHDFYDLLFELIVGLAGRPVPFIGAWPHGCSWALVLTHDVEGRTGYDNLRVLLDLELEEGYRSSWNFVPRSDYSVDDRLLEDLRSNGFEVGVHGLYHDGRDLSPAAFPDRVSAIRSYAEAWHAVGFRSPATLRSAKLMPLLGFDYDSSYSDTAPFEPQRGGCCTWLPYMIENMVELPITLPQDHTLFELLRYTDGVMWLDKARLLRDRGGMVLIVTHPDYVDNPHLVRSYRQLLEEFASDSSAWKALPREVSGWWRRRADSHLQQVNGEWRVCGPAEHEAHVEFAGPSNGAHDFRILLGADPPSYG